MNFLAEMERLRKRVLGILGVALFLASLGGFGFVVQRDFRQNWIFQRDFWTQVTQLAPDIQDGTEVVLRWKNIKDTHFILAHTWTDPLIVSMLYDVPREWRKKPELVIVPNDWESAIQRESTGVYYSFQDASTGAILLEPNNLIWLEADDQGNLMRREGVLELAGSEFPLKAQTRDVELPHLPLYSILIHTPTSR